MKYFKINKENIIVGFQSAKWWQSWDCVSRFIQILHLSFQNCSEQFKMAIQKYIWLPTLQKYSAWGMNGCRAESVSRRKCSTAFWVSDSAGGEDYPWWITSFYIVLWPVHNFKCVQLTVNRKTSCCCQQLWCCSSSTSQQSTLHLP